MEFRILGPVEVWAGDQQLDLGGSKPRALLAVLLLHTNQVVSTDHLVDQLWGEVPPPTARNLVQVYVSRLRRALCDRRDGSAAPVLATRPSGYLLRVEPGELDLDRFEELTAEARRATADRNLEGAAERWCAALTLWRGPALAGAASETRYSGPWCRAWRRPAWSHLRNAWRSTCTSAGTRSWWVSWRRWWPPTQCASACAAS
jgi:DNA-binding SARP family transcriptional activator